MMPPRRANWPGRSTASTRSKLFWTSHSTTASGSEIVVALQFQRAFAQGRRLGDRLAQRLNRGGDHQILVFPAVGIGQQRYDPQPFGPRLIRRIGQVFLPLPGGQQIDAGHAERLEIVECPVRIVDMRADV